MAGLWSPPVGRVTAFAIFPSAFPLLRRPGCASYGSWVRAWPTGTALRVRMGPHTGEARCGAVIRTIRRSTGVRAGAAAGDGGQVLLTKATRDLVAGHLGSGFGLKELGDFRLRDLAAPELIYQLIHADLPAEFPPIGTVAARTGNLPLQVSSFIGRARELQQTAAALSEARLVTLTGPGGVGVPAGVAGRRGGGSAFQ